MKKALIIIGIIIALVLLVALILPEDIHIERTTTINAPVELIFDQVSDLKKNINWSPWFAKDPNVEIEYADITLGLGASYSWSGNNDVGSGTLKVIELTDNQLIKNELDFGEQGGGFGIWEFNVLSSEPNEVEVKWSLQTKMGWPLERYLGLFMESMVGKDFEEGLANLKEVSESLPIPSKIEISEEDVFEITFIGIKDSVAIDEIGMKTGEMFDELVDVMGSNELEIRSNPITVYHVWNTVEGYTIMEVGIPIVSGTELNLEGRVKLNVIPGGPAAKVVHTGPYDNLNESHFAIDEWMSANERQMRGSPWEVYISSPMNESDSSKWITEIYYPVQ